MSTREEWAIFWAAAAFLIGLLGFFVMLRINRRLEDLHNHATGIPMGDIGKIERKIEAVLAQGERHRGHLVDEINGMRYHISSNHDALECKLDDVKDAAVDTAAEVKAKRMEAFAEQLAKEIEARERAKAKGPF